MAQHNTYGQTYRQPPMTVREIPDPFPDKDPDDVIGIKVKHLRQLIRLEYAVLQAFVDGYRCLPDDVMSIYEELGVLREVEQ